MTLEEYKQTVKPGTKVFIMFKGQKLSGVAGNMLESGGPVPIVRFDNGLMSYVTDRNVHLIQLEPLN